MVVIIQLKQVLFHLLHLDLTILLILILIHHKIILNSELSYDELKSVLEGWLNPNAEGETKPASAGLSQPSAPTTQPTEPKAEINAPQKTDEVAAAFDDLFNK